MAKTRLIAALLAGCLLSGASAASHAAASDSIRLSVTPGGMTYGVMITSPAVNHQGYDFGQVALAASTISTMAIAVQNTGNTAEYFAMAVSATSPDSWVPIATGTPSYDEFKLMGRFVTSGGLQPASSAFDVNIDTITSTIPTIAAGRYGQAGRTIPGATSDLYLKLVMPQSVAGPNQQSMTVIINGQHD